MNISGAKFEELLQYFQRYSKKVNTILLYFEKPFKYTAIIFYAIYTLNRTGVSFECSGDDSCCCILDLWNSFQKIIRQTT